MDLKQTTRPTGPTTEDVSGARAIGIFVASAGAYGIGYYLAIATLFSIFGLDKASNAPWELATIGLGSLLAGVSASLVSPRRGWAPLLTAMSIGAVALAIGLFVDIGFDYGIGIGLLVSIAAALTAYASAGR